MSSETIIKNLTNFDLAAHLLTYFKMAFADIHLICSHCVTYILQNFTNQWKQCQVELEYAYRNQTLHCIQDKFS